MRFVAASLLVMMVMVQASAQVVMLNIEDIAGWPNERTTNHTPPLAIDGDIGTFTWVTQSFNTGINFVGIDFGNAVNVGLVRLWKEADGGGGANYKNLVILTTNSSPAIPIEDRVYVPVTGLTNGYQGSELLNATSVNFNGTVTNDIHNSFIDGWASLTFDPVQATGLAIQFSASGFNHYKLYEIEAAVVPEPATVASLLLGGVVVGLWFWRRRHS